MDTSYIDMFVSCVKKVTHKFPAPIPRLVIQIQSSSNKSEDYARSHPQSEANGRA